MDATGLVLEGSAAGERTFLAVAAAHTHFVGVAELKTADVEVDRLGDHQKRQQLLDERSSAAVDAKCVHGRSAQVATGLHILMVVCVAGEATDFLAKLAGVARDGVRSYQQEDTDIQAGPDFDHEASSWIRR